MKKGDLEKEIEKHSDLQDAEGAIEQIDDSEEIKPEYVTETYQDSEESRDEEPIPVKKENILARIKEKFLDWYGMLPKKHDQKREEYKKL